MNGPTTPVTVMNEETALQVPQKTTEDVIETETTTNRCTTLPPKIVVTKPLKLPRMTCDNGYVKKGLLCYQNCPDGYRFNNDVLPVSCITDKKTC